MKLLKLVILGILIQFVYPSITYAQDGFTVKGQLKGLKDSTKLYLIHDVMGRPDTVSTVAAKNEKFTFDGKVPVEAEAYFIKIDKYSKSSKAKPYITLLLENRNVKLNGSLDDLSVDGINVTGLSTHAEFVKYRNDENINKKRNEFSMAVDSFNSSDDISKVEYYRSRMEYRRKIHKDAKQIWIDQHLNSLLTPWIILQTFTKENETEILEMNFNKLTSKAQNSKYGVDLKKEIQARRRVELGSIFYNFQFPEPNGNMLFLNDVLKESKVTVIDFWASWCKPCRAGFPDMKKIYEKYKNQGLRIIGYSVDQNEAAWKKALEQDSLPWYNIRETEKNFAEEYFGIKRIPAVFVLDKKGKILGFDLDKTALEAVIITLLHKDDDN